MTMQQVMGGPVGGMAAGAQMNAGSPSGQNMNITPQDITKKLNTAIYDYLLRLGQYDVARTFCDKMPCETRPFKKEEQKQVNGVEDGLDDQNLPGRPENLPVPMNLGDGPVLQDWWCQFWELWHGQRGRGKAGTMAYVAGQRALQKGRTNLIADPNMQNFRPGFNMMPGMNNGMAVGPADLRKTAIVGNNQQRLTPQQMHQVQQMKMQQNAQNQQQMMHSSAMERQNSQMDGSGRRSGSPGSGDGPSSPKRQRIEGNMQAMPPGRPGQAGQMQGTPVGDPSQLPPPDPARFQHTLDLLRERNLDPRAIAEKQLHNLSRQSTNHQIASLDVYADSMKKSALAALNNMNNDSNVNKGGMNPTMGPGGAQGSPMAQAGLDGTNPEFYSGVNGRMPMAQNPAAAAAVNQGVNGGNHALQDYQMQLMLLEQQNKKRLLMARQEQDMAHPNGPFPPGMSPQGSQRGGDPSPNPNDMRAMIDPTQMPPAIRAQMMGQNGQLMRAPSSHPMMANQQMNDMRAQGVALSNGQFAGGQPGQAQMMQQAGQVGQAGQAQPLGTPRQANNMPPPPAPANATGTQPSSPSAQAQQPPPTPNQTTKAKPGNKKEPANKKGGSNKKGGAANATPATEADQPPTPTPATPATPMNANSFAHKQNAQLPNGAPQPNNATNLQQQQQQQNAAAAHQQQAMAAAQHQQQNAAAVAAQQHVQQAAVAAQQIQQQQQVNSTSLGFDDLLSDGQFQGLDLPFLDGTDLESFDFDTFLNNDGGEVFNFDVNAAFDGEPIA